MLRAMLFTTGRLGLPLLIAATFGAALAFAPVTHAQTAPTVNDDTARAYFKTGKAHFDVGEWEAALADFNESYRLSDRPELLFNIYSCYERLGNAAQAADYLDRYLSLAQVPDADREVLNRKLANLRQRAAVTEQAPAAPVAPAAPAAQSTRCGGGRHSSRRRPLLDLDRGRRVRGRPRRRGHHARARGGRVRRS
jgi:tetratricopeptide (TPR) repeat protein